jgi:signal transduction histidine kinase
VNGAAEAVLADIPRHLTALAEWSACMVYVWLVPRRRGVWVTAGIAAIGLVALLAVQWWAGTFPLALWIPGMLLAAAAMLLLIHAAARTTAITSGYLTARAFVLAELAASAYWQLDRYYAIGDSPLGQTVACLILYAVIFGAAWWVERYNFRAGPLVAGRGELIGAIAIAVGTFGMSNLSFVSVNTPFSGRFGPEIFYIRTLVDFAGFIALYMQQRMRNETQARRDAEAMARLLRSQHDQYELTRRSIDDVNSKYHDMKHHLDALRAEGDASTRGRMLDEIEDSLRGYGAAVHTGNHVLDAILTAKRGFAKEHDVDVSYVADGALLDFLRPLDLTAIVGNAMDNAIEASRTLPDPDRRMVRLALFGHDDFVMLRVENTYDGIVQREHGRIVTLKSGEGHGYGLRNIETAVEAYAGTVTIVDGDEWFSLRLLFPRGSVRHD